MVELSRSCSHVASTMRPPGFSTRAASRMAALRFAARGITSIASRLIAPSQLASFNPSAQRSDFTTRSFLYSPRASAFPRLLQTDPREVDPSDAGTGLSDYPHRWRSTAAAKVHKDVPRRSTQLASDALQVRKGCVVEAIRDNVLEVIIPIYLALDPPQRLAAGAPCMRRVPTAANSAVIGCLTAHRVEILPAQRRGTISIFRRNDHRPRSPLLMASCSACPRQASTHRQAHRIKPSSTSVADPSSRNRLWCEFRADWGGLLTGSVD